MTSPQTPPPAPRKLTRFAATVTPFAAIALVSCSVASSAAPPQAEQATGGTNGSSSGGAGAGAGTSTPGEGDIDLNGSGGSSEDDINKGCANERADTTPLPADILLLLDQSGSMTLDTPNRWEPVTSAMKAFLAQPQLSHLRLGLQYFPLGASSTEDPAICLAANYEHPAVPFSELPAAKSLLTTSIDDHHFTSAEGQDAAHWGTPTRPALEGTFAYISSWAQENQASAPVLILATDGKPSKLCYDEQDELDGIEEITSVIANAASGTPPIRTYVIGIGEIDRLEEWAQAGGTSRGAFVIDAGDPEKTQTEFIEAMRAIQSAELPCTYAIPPPSGGKIDFDRVNVEFTVDEGDPLSLSRVAGPGACTTDLDWYYDDASPPTRLLLCETACETLNTKGGSLDIVFGCATEIR